MNDTSIKRRGHWVPSLPSPNAPNTRAEVVGDLSADDAQAAIRLGFLIHDVSRMRRSAYDQLMKPLGMTRSQWWVLAHLSRHDGMMQTQLAELMDVGKASLGDVVESLENSGCVIRRPEPNDRRVKRVFLARPAQALIKRMTIMEVEFNRQILADLSASERKELTRSLLKVKQAIARLVPSADRPDGASAGLIGSPRRRQAGRVQKGRGDAGPVANGERDEAQGVDAVSV